MGLTINNILFPIITLFVAYSITIPLTIYLIASNFRSLNIGYGIIFDMITGPLVYGIIKANKITRTKKVRNMLIIVLAIIIIIVSIITQLTITLGSIIVATFLLVLVGAEAYLPARFIQSYYRRYKISHRYFKQHTLQSRSHNPVHKHSHKKRPSSQRAQYMGLVPLPSIINQIGRQPSQPVFKSFWPLPSDYQDAIQNPKVCFKDHELKATSVIVDSKGMPKADSGNFSCVFKLTFHSKDSAIKCFTSPVTQGQRYDILSKYIMNYNMPFLVNFHYIEDGILVMGRYYPVLKMDWVDGKALHLFVSEHINEKEVILNLAEEFRSIIQQMEKARIAHGDLQHGNIMVLSNGKIVLVDYDCMFIPAFKGQSSPEVGHYNYQHLRRPPSHYDESIDNFSAIVIYLSLRAIALEPDLWKFHNGDNLILVKDDFQHPISSKCLERLVHSNDRIVRYLAKLLQDCCTSDPVKVPSLQTALYMAGNNNLGKLDK